MKKSTPSLPGSSRLKMPSQGGNAVSMVKEVGGMKAKSGATKRIMAGANKKGMSSKNSYC
jgi:hypothetical protein